MAVDYVPASEREHRLNDVLAAYFEAAETDRQIDRQRLLELHPEMADDLRLFFAEQDDVAQMARPLRSVVHETFAATGLDEETTPQPDTAKTASAPAHSFGDYEALVEIGRGGMGVVYRARQRSLDRHVALKMVLSAAFASTNDVQQLKREAEAAARLDHPNIVSVYEVGEHAGQPFFSMQLIEGGNLADHAKRLGEHPRQAALLLQVVARAVHYAHQRGILHRDLKPSNILLDRDGQPHITDFGLAKRIDADGSLTRSGILIGTPYYMAPEQAAGQHGAVTTATDVFGLGAVLYALLTGQPPFQADTLFDTLEQLQKREPVRPGQRNPRVDRDLETICLKCLHKDPGGRYQSAADLADDLERYQKGELIQARPSTSWERAGKWIRRRPTVAALMAMSGLAAMALLAVAVGSYYHVQLRKERDEVDRQRGQAEEQRALANRYLYDAQMNLAYRQWQEGSIARVLEILEERRPKNAADHDLRGFEWHYLWRLCHNERFKLSSRVFAISPDGRFLAGIGLDGMMRIVDAANGQELRSLPGHGGVLLRMASSPDGVRLASVGSGDKTVRIWDVATGKQLSAFKVPISGGVSRAFRADGKRFAIGESSGAVSVWDTVSGEKALSLNGHTRPISSLAFSDDRQRIATSSLDGTVRLWDAGNGQPIQILRGETKAVCKVLFSPDGQRLATAGSSDGTVRLWDARNGQPMQILRGHSEAVCKVVFSPDGQRFATAGRDATVRVWDAVLAREIRALTGHQGMVITVAFSPDGKGLVSGGADQTIRLWDAMSGQELAVLRGHTCEVTSVAFSPDGKEITSGSPDGTVRMWDVTKDPEALILKVQEDGIDGLVFSPNASCLSAVSYDQTLRTWDLTTRQEIGLVKGPAAPVECLALSPDGRRLASGRSDGTIRLSNAADGREIKVLDGHTERVTVVTFSPDCRRLASGSADRTVRVWDSGTGQLVHAFGGNSTGISCLAFSPDGRRLASNGEWPLEIRSQTSGQETTVISSIAGSPQSLAFSPDGQWLASAGYMSLTIYDAISGRIWRLLRGHSAEVRSVAFSPDGKRLASGSLDKTVRIWDAATGQEILALKGPAGFSRSLAFSPDGMRLAAACQDKTVRIWDATARR